LTLLRRPDLASKVKILKLWLRYERNVPHAIAYTVPVQPSYIPASIIEIYIKESKLAGLLLSLLPRLDQLWLCGSKHSSLRGNLSGGVLQQCQIPSDKFAATLGLRNISALYFDDGEVDFAVLGLPNLASFGLGQYATLEPPLNAPATGLNIKQVILTATCKDEDQQWLNRCAFLRLLPRLDVLDLYSVRNTLETDEFEAWGL
jgi:hypothetical protein